MAKALSAILVLAWCGVAVAQVERLVERGRQEAGEARRLGKWREADQALRQAVRLAESARLNAAEAACLLDLAEVHDRTDRDASPEAVTPLLRKARRLAARAGRADLELDALAWLFERDASLAPELIDAATAFRDLSTLEWAAREGADVEGAYRVLDAMADADLGGPAEAALEAAEEENLPRTAALLRLRIGGQANLRAALKAFEAHDDLPNQARVLLALAGQGGDVATLRDALRRAAESRDEGLEAECLARLGQPRPAALAPRADAPRTRTDLARLEALLNAGGEASAGAATIVMLGRRHDALPVLVGSAKKDPSPEVLEAIESLARRGDVPVLLPLLDVEPARDSAAVAILSAAGPEDIDAVRQARERAPSPYLDAALARAGNRAALEALRRDDRPEAAAALGALGFATPLAALARAPKPLRVRLLARAPATWGAGLLHDLLGDEDRSVREAAARAAARRGGLRRIGLAAGEPGARVRRWLLPATPREAREAGPDLVSAIRESLRGPEAALAAWATTESGGTLPDARRVLEAEGALNEFARADLQANDVPSGGPQTRVLYDIEDSGSATCRVTLTPREAFVDGRVLTLTFDVDRQVDATGSGIAGILYRDLSMQIQAAELIQAAYVSVAGGDSVQARIATARSTLSVSLGLPENVTDVREVAASVRLKFGATEACMDFVLPVFMPQDPEKPDLAVERIELDPSAPEPDHETLITACVRNLGQRVRARGSVIMVIFTISNPQAEGGRRTLGAIVDDASGWKPGEVRHFVLRPRLVADCYMNRYSPTWSPQLGDTEVRVEVDADRRLEEASEENNFLSRPVGLYLPEALARDLAGQELLDMLRRALGRCREAATEDDMFGAAREADRALERSKVRTPEIEAALAHLRTLVNMRAAAFRVNRAAERLRAAGRDRGRLLDAAGDLARAQVGLLESGVPMDEDTLQRVRTTLSRLNAVPEIAGQLGELREVLEGEDLDLPESVGHLSDALGTADRALLAMQIARDLRTTGEIDAGRAIELAAEVPGADAFLTGPHRVMLEAELGYAREGARRNTEALGAVNSLLADEEGAEERLDRAVAEAEAHYSSGPFTRETLRSLASSVVEDLPVIGTIIEFFTSE